MCFLSSLSAAVTTKQKLASTPGHWKGAATKASHVKIKCCQKAWRFPASGRASCNRRHGHQDPHSSRRKAKAKESHMSRIDKLYTVCIFFYYTKNSNSSTKLILKSIFRLAKSAAPRSEANRWTGCGAEMCKVDLDRFVVHISTSLTMLIMLPTQSEHCIAIFFNKAGAWAVPDTPGIILAFQYQKLTCNSC